MKTLSTRGFAFALCCVLLSQTACSLNLNAPILPNISLHDLPDLSKLGGSPSDLTSKSKSDSESGNKRSVSNLDIETSVASTLKINALANCAQVTLLSDESVVVDFSGTACPAIGTTIPSGDIKFTATYQRVGNSDVYEMSFTDKYGDTSTVGTFRIDRNTEKGSVTQLCTGTYTTNCFVSVKNNAINGPLINY